MLWDVFCKVVDNFGDIGVCWRLCLNLTERGQQVRLWVDDASALQWMAPNAAAYASVGLTVHDWQMCMDPGYLEKLPFADVWVEAFGCSIAPEFIAFSAHPARPRGQNHPKLKHWINLEYLSAESYVEKSHSLPSPVMHGPGAGLVKHFFYPGFTSGTGGLLREVALLDRQSAFAAGKRASWLRSMGVVWNGERLISLFCYDPPALKALLQQLARENSSTQLLVTSGRAALATASALQALGWVERDSALATSINKDALTVNFLPAMSQDDFDHLLWATDLNFVRGEDSLVRALWAGKPLIWNIYAQEDGAHIPKLNAFLDLLDAPPSMRRVHYAWNGSETTAEPDALTCVLPLAELAEWEQTIAANRSKLLLMGDLCTQLIEFVQKNH